MLRLLNTGTANTTAAPDTPAKLAQYIPTSAAENSIARAPKKMHGGNRPKTASATAPRARSKSKCRAGTQTKAPKAARIVRSEIAVAEHLRQDDRVHDLSSSCSSS